MEIRFFRGLVTSCGLLLSGTFFFLGSAQAAPITIANHSFENPSATTLAVIPTSWTRIGNSFAYNPFRFKGADDFYLGANAASDPGNGGAGYPGIDGSNVGYVFSESAGTGFEQTLGAVFTANTAYALTIAQGRRNGDVFGAPTLGTRLELLAGTTVVASAVDNTGPTPGAFVDLTASLADSNVFSSLFGQALTIRVSTTLPVTATNQASDWDNVRLDASALPAPATLALFSLGLMGLRIGRRATR